VAVMVRHFRCLQGKEARQTAQKAVQKRAEGKGEREEGRAGRRIRQQPIRLARPRVDAHIGVRPSLREIPARGGDKSEQRAC
jgi:hypothetical protein